MTFTLAAWMVPTLICLLILAWAILIPLPDSGGDYNFAREASSVFRAVVVIVVSLIVWLAYFAVT
ncbi:MAG TPA: hypothetical protein VE079_16050 [Ensifer sp.]|nr:hypothetical protein [Ensifer sp.]